MAKFKKSLKEMGLRELKNLFGKLEGGTYADMSDGGDPVAAEQRSAVRRELHRRKEEGWWHTCDMCELPMTECECGHYRDYE